MMEELEVTCWKKIQGIVRSEEGLGIEFDENTICDVCRSVSFINPNFDPSLEISYWKSIKFHSSHDIINHDFCYLTQSFVFMIRWYVVPFVRDFK